MIRISSLLVMLLLSAGFGLSSCEVFSEPKCGCTPPPPEPIKAAALSQVSTWWLYEHKVGDQFAREDAIKDRFSMQFRADGTYTQTMLSDGTDYEGTWMLMGTDNRTLHLTDHKGSTQEFMMATAGTVMLAYYRQDKNNQTEYYSFKSTK
ncbi:hypothetical protein GCM10027346_10060 [Hymenobacter seoulensis]